MHEFPRWKLILLSLILAFGALYSVPNLFQNDPAVQISANRGNPLDEAIKERVQGALEKAKLRHKAIEIEEARMLVRLYSGEDQPIAAEAIGTELGDGYTVALNLAPTVPGWLAALRAHPLTLGLDLQGGVHFLMEVDQRAALVKQGERMLDDTRTLLREKGVRYRGIAKTAQGMTITLRTETDRDAAFGHLSREMPQLTLENGPVGEESYPLLATVKETELHAQMDKALEQNIATLRNRINQLGVAEPIVQQQGESRIVIQLPGVQDTALAKKILGATATLEYRGVDEKGNVADALAGRVPPESRLYRMRDGTPILLSKKIIVSGDQLTDASSSFDENGRPSVNVTLNDIGGRRMQEFTNDNVGNRMGVVFIETLPEIKIVDGKEVRTKRVKEEVINAAVVQEPFGKKFRTTGLDSPGESSELALLLRAGSLAAPVDIVEERTIGPSLGKDNIERALRATVVGFALVLAFMAIYYRVFGLIANFALIANTILLAGILSVFKATLTMPGIAALLLTIGMAVDANVLICERIREELRAGNSPLASIKAGYEKAWATIVDANVTHMISALALFLLGSGPIRGFALVLLVGIMTSVFTAVTVSEAVVYLVYSRRRRLKSLSI